MTVSAALSIMTPAHRARLFVNGQKVPHPFVGPAEGGAILTVVSQPVEQAVTQVFEAIYAGRTFCVTRGEVIDADDDAGFLHTLTSGSTGSPKRIRRTLDSWCRSFAANRDLFEITADDRSAVLGSLDHSLALYAMCEGLWQGLSVDVLSGLRPDRQAEAMQRDGTTILYATPTQLRTVLQIPLPSLRVIAVGGGFLDEGTRSLVALRAPNARLIEFYGAAETSFVTMSDADTPPGSVGRAYPGVQLQIRNSDHSGEGEVWVSSPFLFDGYAEGYSNSTKRDGNWITVGEMGSIKDGYLFLTGRIDRMFTVSDRNYHPEAAENALSRIAGVDHIAVLPKGDVKRGAVPVVFFSGSVSPETLQTEARGLLGPLAPRRAYRLSDFPLLPSAKPDLQALASMLERLE